MVGATEPLSRKGAERRARILESALVVIGRDGLAALSMRSLAAEAGLPLGALGYYFANKRELVDEAFAAHAHRELQRVVRALASLDAAASGADLAERLAAFVIDGLEHAEHALVAEYEFLVEASRRPEIAREATAWQQTLLVQLGSVLTRLGSTAPDTDARLIMATIAGLEVDNLTHGRLRRSQALDIRASLDRLVDALSRAWAQDDRADDRRSP